MTTVTLVGLALVGAACGTTSATPTTTSGASHRLVATGLVGKRYCEVLLVHLGSAGLYADVYNTYPLNACPPGKWTALDATLLAEEHHALFAELNGPRFWLMDSIQKVRTSTEQITTFGGIAMILEATVELGPSIAAAQLPYTPHTVSRQAAFTFDTGRQVYELVAPDGTVWVMQTYSQIKVPTLSQADLPGLASRLTLPAGWIYRVRTLGPARRGGHGGRRPCAPGQSREQLLEGDSRVSGPGGTDGRHRLPSPGRWARRTR